MRKFLLALLVVGFLSTLAHAQIAITWPTHRQVFQRNSVGSGSATVLVMGQLFTCNTPSKYRILTLDPKTEGITGYGSWTTISTSLITAGGLFKLTLPLNTGWYKVEITTDESVMYGVTFGVGDVYVIAGQSNAQGNVGTTLYTLSPYKAVVSVNVNDNCRQTIAYPSFGPIYASNRIGPNGHNTWNWVVLGNKIIDNYNVPVAFINAAAGGSTVDNWAVSSTGAATNSVYGLNQYCSGYLQPVSSYPASYYIGQPYLGLKNALKFYGSMFGVRAVLWHQGEANTDKTPGITSAQYNSSLTTVINQSRADYSGSLAWYVSLASTTRNPSSPTPPTPPIPPTITNDNVLSGQLNRASANNRGPYTDGITTRDPTDLTHIAGNGLLDLGNYWFSQTATLPTAVSGSPHNVNLNSMSNGSPNAAGTAPFLYTSGGQIFAPGGYAEYRWVYDEGNISTSFASTSSISSPSSFSNYRCYMKTTTGNWVLSNKVMWPLQYNICGARQGADENKEELEPNFNSHIFPNPVNDNANIRFTLKSESHVNLEILDASGKVIKRIVDNSHAAGTFTYPLQIQSRGTFYYKLSVDGISVTRKFLKTE